LFWSGSSKAIKNMLNFKHGNRPTEINTTAYMIKVKLVACVKVLWWTMVES